MAIDFNTTPYYDDFDEDKNFHRILFRPGRAVQARELTQSQTILQDQVTKFGNHLFKDGSRVTGAEVFGVGEGKIDKLTINLQPSINHINLAPLLPAGNANGVLVQSATAVNVASLINTFITVPITGIGPANASQNVSSSNVVARNIFFVHHADPSQETEAGTTDPDTLYVSFLRSDGLFAANGALNVNSVTLRTGLPGEKGNNFINGSLGNVTVGAQTTINVHSSGDLSENSLIAIIETANAANHGSFGDAKLLGITEGVYFTNGVFVKNKQEIIAADKYGKTANVSIGFQVTESVVKSSDDTSLLDPALDSSNYLATGADRYKINLSLSRKQLDLANQTPEISSSKYIEVARYKNGQLIKDATSTKYSDLGRTLARRTYDESGDYIVNGLEPLVRNLGNTDTGILTVGKGKAYVKGYEINKISNIDINLPKSRNTETVASYSLEQSYGNFIFVSGANNTLFTDNVSFPKVSLHSSNLANGIATTRIESQAQNTKIGEAHVKNVEFIRNDGPPAVGARDNNVYKLSLFNIRATGNAPLSLTRTIVAEGISGSANANANVHSTSILTHRTEGRLANGTNNMIVSDASGIRVGDMVDGHNVSNNGPVPGGPGPLAGAAGNTGSVTASTTSIGKRIAFVTAVRGSNIELSCTVFSGTTTNLGDGFFTDKGSNTYTFSRATFTDTNEDTSIFPLSYNYVSNTGLTSYTYRTRKLFSGVDFTAGVGTISLPGVDGRKTFIAASTDDDKRKNYQVTVTTGGTGTNPTGLLVPVISSVTTTTGTTPTAEIDIGDGSFGGTANIVATVLISNAQNDRRFLTSRRRYQEYANGTHTQLAGTKTKKISLGQPYVINVEAIYIATPGNNATDANVNVRDAFIFDTGQRESFFDQGTIRLRANNTLSNGYPDTAKINVGKMNVIFNHITSVQQGYMDVSSYGPIVRYEAIPQFTKKDGTIISLRDSVDFRPFRANSNTPNLYSNTDMTFAKIEMPDSGVPTASMTLDYHLPRNDKLVLGFDGNFRVIQGEPALNDPPTPADDPDSMTIAKLGLEAYTPEASNVKLEIVKNKRYTMKDISGLDDRITRVEYYTSLNLLESELASTSFFSNNNTELLSNGFIVDPFRGHSIGDVANPDYKCAIDYDNELLRPRFKANAATAAESSTEQTLRNTGGRLTLNYGSEIYTSQATATGTININPFNVVGFVGHVKLATDVATYADFDARPFVGINTDGNSDNFEYGENFTGSRWGEWDLISFDKSDAKVYTYYDTKNQKSRTSTSAEVAGYQSQKTETDKVFYFAQAQNIDFEIFGYRPNTDVRAFIDGKNVSDKLQRFDSDTGSFVVNDPSIVSDVNGFAKGRIALPNDEASQQRFFAGEHQIIFCNSIFNPTFHTTIATTRYFSGKPRVVVVEQEQTVVEEQQPAPENYNCDFYMNDAPENQECISIADLNSRLISQGVSAATVAGWGPRIYDAYDDVFSPPPGQGVKRTPDVGGYGYYLKKIDTGDFSHLKTRFNDAEAIGLFEQHLRGSDEYANTQLGIYVDPLAQTFFVNEFTNPKGIFVPSVSVWFATKDTTLPVTLEIRKTVNGYPSADDILLNARVTKNPDDVILAESADTDKKTEFTFDKPIFLEPGEYSIVLLTNSSNYTTFIATVGEVRVDNGQVVADQPYTGSLFKSQNARTWEPDQLSDLAFEIRKCAFNTGPATFTDVEAQIGNLPEQFVDYMKVSVPYETYSRDTKLSFQLSTTANGSSKTFNASELGPAKNVYPEADINFENRQMFADSRQANLRVIMSTTNADVSPTFELDKCRFIFAENLLNSKANTDVTNNPETQNESGGALSKYITKKIKLADDFDATSLRVILSKNLPEGASVEVYYRVQSGVDQSEFEELPYVLMNQITPTVTSQNYTDFYDCEYRAEDITYVNAENTFDNFRYFAIKVVLYSTNTAKPPTIKNFRAIALS